MVDLVRTRIGEDGKRSDVKNPTKLKPSNNISFDEEGNVVLNLPKINVNSKAQFERLVPTYISEKGNKRNEGAGQYILNTLGNVPGSTKELLSDYYQAIRHPIDTFNGVKSMAIGFQELRDRSKFIKANPGVEPPPLTENMIMAEAVNEHFANRYGDWVGNETDDWDVIGNKFLETFREDPAGVMADVSGVLTLGATGVTKFGGKVGSIANTVKNVSANLDPVQGLLTGGGKLANMASGTMTGKGTGLLNAAFDAGEAGGKAQESFKLAKSGKLTPTKVMQEFNEKVNKMKESARNQYESWINGLSSDYVENLQTPAFILKELEEIKFGKKGKQQRPLYSKQVDAVEVESLIIDPKTGKGIPTQGTKTTTVKRGSVEEIAELNKLEAEVLEYANNDILHNPQALAQLKLKLGRMKFESPAAQKLQKDINKKIKIDLGDADPNTTKVMSDYEGMLNNLDNLKQTIGNPTDKTWNPQAAITKAQALLKDNPRGSLGFDKANPILMQIESDLIPSLSGLGLSDLTSPSTKALGGGILAGSSLEGVSLFGAQPQFGGYGQAIALSSAAALPLSSPNLMGTINNAAGVASRYGLNSGNAGNFSRGILNPLTSSTEAPFGDGLNDVQIQNLMNTANTSEPLGYGVNNLFEFFK
tara:strand:- start:75 stop:2015 length:1941 start_codon:yes stop_codon:yes gene_type:complete